MSYTHLTISERTKIEPYFELGYSIRAIAKRIHRSPSTISRELHRHQNCTIEETKVNCGAKVKLTADLKDVVQKKLIETWSPEQIADRLYPGELSLKVFTVGLIRVY